MSSSREGFNAGVAALFNSVLERVGDYVLETHEVELDISDLLTYLDIPAPVKNSNRLTPNTKGITTPGTKKTTVASKSKATGPTSTCTHVWTRGTDADGNLKKGTMCGKPIPEGQDRCNMHNKPSKTTTTAKKTATGTSSFEPASIPEKTLKTVSYSKEYSLMREPTNNFIIRRIDNDPSTDEVIGYRNDADNEIVALDSAQKKKCANLRITVGDYDESIKDVEPDVPRGPPKVVAKPPVNVPTNKKSGMKPLPGKPLREPSSLKKPTPAPVAAEDEEAIDDEEEAEAPAAKAVPKASSGSKPVRPTGKPLSRPSVKVEPEPEAEDDEVVDGVDDNEEDEPIAPVRRTLPKKADEPKTPEPKSPAVRSPAPKTPDVDESEGVDEDVSDAPAPVKRTLRPVGRARN